MFFVNGRQERSELDSSLVVHDEAQHKVEELSDEESGTNSVAYYLGARDFT
jgi:hypothetical protein